MAHFVIGFLTYYVSLAPVNIMMFWYSVIPFWRTMVYGVGRVQWFHIRYIYVKALSPWHIYSYCPPSHKATIQSIILLSMNDWVFLQPSDESICLGSWVWILQGLHKDDIRYVHTTDADHCNVLVVPHQCPYDDAIEKPEPHFHQWKLFDKAKAIQKYLAVAPIEGSSGIIKCYGEFYFHGLLCCSLHHSSLEIIDTPHPDHITLHTTAQVYLSLIKQTQTYHVFSTRFWKEGDLVCPINSPLVRLKMTVVFIDFNQSTVDISPCDSDLPGCTLLLTDIHCIFRTGDNIQVIADIHCRSTEYVLSPDERDATVLIELNNIVSLAVLHLNRYSFLI